LVDGAIWSSGAQANQLPGGSGLVELRNVQFESAQMALNHHCALGGAPTGGICASHYWIRDPVGTYASSLQFQDETYNATGHRSNLMIEYDNKTWVLPNAHVTFATSTCDRTTEAIVGGASGSYWVRCPQDWGIRIVRIYSPNRGTLLVNDGNVTYQIPPFAVTTNAGIGGYAAYSPAGRAHAAGYSFLVKNNSELTIVVQTKVDDELFVLEYSENTWPIDKTTRVRLTVTETYSSGSVAVGFDGGPIWILSNHSRDWVTPYGAIIPQAGAWWQGTGGWTTSYNASDYNTKRISMLSNNGVNAQKAGGAVVTRS